MMRLCCARQLLFACISEPAVVLPGNVSWLSIRLCVQVRIATLLKFVSRSTDILFLCLHLGLEMSQEMAPIFERLSAMARKYVLYPAARSGRAGSLERGNSGSPNRDATGEDPVVGQSKDLLDRAIAGGCLEGLTLSELDKVKFVTASYWTCLKYRNAHLGLSLDDFVPLVVRLGKAQSASPADDEEDAAPPSLDDLSFEDMADFTRSLIECEQRILLSVKFKVEIFEQVVDPELS